MFEEADRIDIIFTSCFYLKYEYRWPFLMFLPQETKISHKLFGKTFKIQHGLRRAIYDRKKLTEYVVQNNTAQKIKVYRDAFLQ